MTKTEVETIKQKKDEIFVDVLGAVIENGCIISSGATVDRNVRIPEGTHIDCGRVVTAGYSENKNDRI